MGLNHRLELELLEDIEYNLPPWKSIFVYFYVFDEEFKQFHGLESITAAHDLEKIGKGFALLVNEKDCKFLQRKVGFIRHSDRVFYRISDIREYQNWYWQKHMDKQKFIFTGNYEKLDN